MIFAKVDVELRDHDKAHEAGEAMASWLSGLLWTRSKAADGFVARVALKGFWVGESRAVKHMATLVRVGLASVVDGGWLLAGYADKNDTKVDIETRKAEQRERKSRFDARRKGNVSKLDEGNALPERYSRVSNATESEREPEPEPERDLKRGERLSAPALVLPGLVEPVAKADPRGSRLPADWQPKAETLDVLRSEGAKSLETTLRSFVDYWTGEAGSKARKADWEATFRGWVRRDLAKVTSAKPAWQQRKDALSVVQTTHDDYGVDC